MRFGYFFVFISTGILLLAGCSKTDEETRGAVDVQYRAFISAYTSGVISIKDPVKIHLAKSVDGISPGEKEARQIFEFKPEVDGETIWEDNRTLVFVPEKPLKPGTRYGTTMDLGELFDVPADKKNFKFTFQTREQNFEVRVEGILFYDAGDDTSLRVKGQLFTSDYAGDEAVEKVLRGTQDDEKLKITWEHHPRVYAHQFIIEDVARATAPGVAVLEWDGSSIGVEQKGEKSIDIPALGDYRVLSTRMVHGTDSYVVVSFSDPLMEKQNLAGLVTFRNIVDEPRLVVHLNELRIYPTIALEGKVTLEVQKSVKNHRGHPLKENYVTELEFNSPKPELRLADDDQGVILPASGKILFPFEAIGLKSVDVTVVRIFEDNVLQYLQVNRLGGDYQLRRVGRPVLRKHILLNINEALLVRQWNRFTVDLSDILSAEPGAVYQIRIGFGRKDALYYCPESGQPAGDDEGQGESWDFPNDRSYWEDDYYYDYDWSQRDNPCSSSYYTSNRSIAKILFASDIGLIAKKNDHGDVEVYVTNLVTTEPLEGVTVDFYNYQQQKIGNLVTDEAGRGSMTLDAIPFALVAKHLGQTGYLKMDDGSALSLSNFDVTGKRVRHGFKGFIYGERGVWRPGDTLHIGFMVEDKQNLYKMGQPVILSLFGPEGQLFSRTVDSRTFDNLFVFEPVLPESAPTGNWTAQVRFGSTNFKKRLKIEAVKPNRLKIQLDFEKQKLTALDHTVDGKLVVKWLHGATASRLKAELKLSFAPMKTTFKQFPGYSFDDPSKEFEPEPELVFQGRLDGQGRADIRIQLPVDNRFPGARYAIFNTRVFEVGGDFSLDQFKIPYYPYKRFVGVKVPEGDKRGMLLTDKDHTIRIACVDADGRPVSSGRVQVELYKLNWKWWWDKSWENISHYVGRSYKKPVQKGTVKITNGEGTWKLKVKYPQWGRYYLRVTDPVSGHSSGQVLYVDWPGWAGKGKRGDLGGAVMLDVVTDRDDYQVDEEVEVTFASPARARALVSLENGSRVIRAFWVETEEKRTRVTFKCTGEMAPNVYVHVTMIQPHAQTVNDLPIRMYGIKNIQVTDPVTRLEPEIDMPGELRPEQIFTVHVKENRGRPMTYTLAIVDEGLLDLTRFKTPDPWNGFYSREALGVKTWDIYDDVLGAFGGQMQRLLSIGGDDEIKPPGENKAQRFKPVVIFRGPFHVKAGKTASHTLKMPYYVGSVRTMIVAAHDGAYGRAERATPVKQKLMVLATLPRVAGPGEDIVLPVDVFNMEEGAKTVQVTVVAAGRLKVKGKKQKEVVFDRSGDKIVYFNLRSEDLTGMAKVKIRAVAGGLTARYEVELQVRPSNPEVTNIDGQVISAAGSWESEYVPAGMTGTNNGVLELSHMPALNLKKRLKFLVRYPHGCVEQTTSAAFAQLYLHHLTDMDAGRKKEIEAHINAGVEQLAAFQLPSGGLAYWPGGRVANAWGTSYAGHFLSEAKKQGYYVPEQLLAKWTQFQKKMVDDWIPFGTTPDLVQSYRLYTLAISGSPALGAMNRMKESRGISNRAKWRLALTYALLGYEKEASGIISSLSMEVKEYRELSGTFGSALRDKAMILETLIALDRREGAFELLREIAGEMGDGRRWMSTQTTAYCLIAAAKYAEKYPVKGLAGIELSIAGKKTEVQADKFITTLIIEKPDEKAAVSVDNTGEVPMYVRLIRSGIPLTGREVSASRNIDMNVTFTDMQGNRLDVAQLAQGLTFRAEITVFNPGLKGDYEELALTQIFPSGWEIINERLNQGDETRDHPAKYRDIRDDRVYSYFDLKAGERKSFTVTLNASYPGRFYLPAFKVEAMYDNRIHANNEGRWVEIIRP